VKWRVYYDDGSTWHSGSGLNGMPLDGVVCILQGSPNYRVTYGAPYYAFYDGEWLHFHTNDLVDYAQHGRTVDKLLMGRMVTKRTFNHVFGMATRDKNAENL